MTELLRRFEELRAGGRKLLVPYVMGGVPDRNGFPEVVATVGRDADALEVGLPFSDPLMDGPVIAAAGARAIRGGAGPLEVLEWSAGATTEAPLVAMTYYNPIHHLGERDFCARLGAAGFAGLIVPDIPVEESAGLRDAAAEEGVAWVPLVAPTSSAGRVAAIVATATGFVYAVSTLGVTGTRDELSERAAKVVGACREATDLPILVGIGVSSATQARAAAGVADGVVIGSAVVSLVLERGAAAAAEWLGEVRRALDELSLNA